MNVLIHLRTTAVVFMLPLAAHAQDALVAKYGCGGCHQADRKILGPSWNDIAAKYADGSKSAADLAKSIRDGNAGIWGPIPMPAQPNLPEADASALATWILLKKK